MKEEWKEIKEFNGYYISNLGAVKKISNNGKFIPVHIYVQKAKGKKPVCKFCVNMKRYVQQLCVHRIVAQYFCSGCGRFVRHKDGNIFNNTCNNLYYTDEILHPNNKSTSKKTVEQYSLSGVLINIYSSITEASKKNGLCISGICEACLGKANTCGGYKWKYAESNNK